MALRGNQKETRLDKLEKQIWSAFRSLPSDKVLLAVHRAIKQSNDPSSVIHQVFPLDHGGFHPFVGAGISAFTIRFSNPNRYGEKEISFADLANLYNLVFDYLTADPITADEELAKNFFESNPVFMVLRVVAGQFPFEVNTFGSIGRPLLLFGELPKDIENRKGIPKFDFPGKFQNLTGLSIGDFVASGFVAWAASSSKNIVGLTRGYFGKARSQGIKLPDDDGISLFLNCIAADPDRIRQNYEQMRQRDRRFRMYDFNPLLTFPILRPWHHHSKKAMGRDKMVAPLPDLIAYRTSTGIFYEMFNHYTDRFSEYFGHLFEAYTGRLLAASVRSGALISEESIRQTYDELAGKVPDWVVLDGSTAVLIECKATRFSLTALATGARESVDYSLKQVLTGLKQLHEFREAIIRKAPGLERFHYCAAIKPVLVTFEPLYLINSLFFRRHVNQVLKTGGITDLPWSILSLKELECFQPHLGSGMSLSETLSAMETKSFNEVVQYLHARTRLTYKDSILYQFDQRMYDRLKPAI